MIVYPVLVIVAATTASVQDDGPDELGRRYEAQKENYRLPSVYGNYGERVSVSAFFRRRLRRTVARSIRFDQKRRWALSLARYRLVSCVLQENRTCEKPVFSDASSAVPSKAAAPKRGWLFLRGV